MDAKKLKEFVEEVAVIIDGNRVGPNGKSLSASKVKIKKTVKIIENEFGEEEEVVEIETDFNETLPWHLKELKPVYKNCELNCGKIVANQIIDKKLYQTPVPHWRTICRRCQKAISPDGAELISGNANIQNTFSKHFNWGKDK